jgi:hypothetical protein
MSVEEQCSSLRRRGAARRRDHIGAACSPAAPPTTVRPARLANNGGTHPRARELGVMDAARELLGALTRERVVDRVEREAMATTESSPAS